jgi:hypothetical protein
MPLPRGDFWRRPSAFAAAIPAVVIYNALARAIAHYCALFANASVEVLTLVSRDLRQRPTSVQPAAVDWRAPAAVSAE